MTISDFDRAVEFAGCERRLDAGGDEYCHTRIIAGHRVYTGLADPGWPCPETIRVLALIREARADEREQSAAQQAYDAP